MKATIYKAMTNREKTTSRTVEAAATEVEIPKVTQTETEKNNKTAKADILSKSKDREDKNIIIVNGIRYRAQPNTKITYYCPCYQCSEGYSRGTSSGKTATAGKTVAMPAGVSFGTKIYQNSHTYICEDRGGAITSGHIDIFCDTHSECYQHSDSGIYQKIYIEVK